MIPLEDNFSDILRKAMQGLTLSSGEAAAIAGIPEHAVQRLLAGDFDENNAQVLAPALKLQGDALIRLAQGKYEPSITPPPWLAMVTTALGDMTVNAYIVWDPETRGAAIFDTGAEARPLLDVVQRENLEVAAIFLTHSHPDHIAALDDLVRALDVEVWSSEIEPVHGTKTFRAGDLFNAGRHFIRTRLTPGHSPGGTTFLIEGLEIKLAMVGDALFAGSIGGIRQNYAEALKTIEREILGLPEDTILCPGHGPLTSVALEKMNNPFFNAAAAAKRLPTYS